MAVFSFPRNLAVADATNNLLLNTQQFTETTLSGQNFASQEDLNRFAERSDSREFKDLSEALGITDEEWRVMTPELFNRKFGAFIESEKAPEKANTNLN